MSKSEETYVDPFTGIVVYDKPWKNWLFYGLLVSIIPIMIGMFIYFRIKEKPILYKCITKYGIYYYEAGSDNTPVVGWNYSKITKGDTDIITGSNGMVYKIVQVKVK